MSVDPGETGPTIGGGSPGRTAHQAVEWSWERRRPGWAFNVWFIPIGMAALASAATPEGSIVLALAALGFFGVLGILWLVRLVFYATHWPLIRQPRALMAFVVPPLLVLGAFVAAEQGVPLRVGFELSRSQFEAEVRELARTGPAPSIDDDVNGEVEPMLVRVDERLGIYRVSEIERDEEGTIFYREVASSGLVGMLLCFFCTRAGFAYSPDQDPPVWLVEVSSELIDLGGGWYAFSWGWD